MKILVTGAAGRSGRNCAGIYRPGPDQNPNPHEYIQDDDDVGLKGTDMLFHAARHSRKKTCSGDGV